MRKGKRTYAAGGVVKLIKAAIKAKAGAKKRLSKTDKKMLSKKDKRALAKSIYGNPKKETKKLISAERSLNKAFAKDNNLRKKLQDGKITKANYEKQYRRLTNELKRRTKENLLTVGE